MSSSSSLMKLVGDQFNFDEAVRRSVLVAAQAKRDTAIACGPPLKSRITLDAWECWHKHGWLSCPRTGKTCSDPECGVGGSCKVAARYGVRGDSSALPFKDRPSCGAKTRQAKPCSKKVIPGKRRCRFHGGLSTGPKTIEGRARIAAAQRRRWGRCAVPVVTDPYQEAEFETTGETFMSI